MPSLDAQQTEKVARAVAAAVAHGLHGFWRDTTLRPTPVAGVCVCWVNTGGTRAHLFVSGPATLLSSLRSRYGRMGYQVRDRSQPDMGSGIVIFVPYPQIVQ